MSLLWKENFADSSRKGDISSAENDITVKKTGCGESLTSCEKRQGDSCGPT